MDSRKRRFRIQSDKLIALLDRYLFLNGQTLTSFHYGDVFTTPGEKARHVSCNSTPASLQYFPPVSLREHLDDQTCEKAEVALLRQRITEACEDEAVVACTKNFLAQEYAKFKGPQENMEAFKRRNVASMLALLRAEETKAQMPAVQTFTLRAISEIDEEGKVRRIAMYSKPHDASWKEVQTTLTTMTLWQAQNFGFPKGYSLLDGKWTYQITQGLKLDKTHHDLATTEQYREMRRMLDKDTMAGVLIWHEVTWQASQIAKAEAEKKRKQRLKDFGGSPGPEEKSPYNVEARDLPGLMGQWVFDMRPPSAAAPSDDEGED